MRGNARPSPLRGAVDLMQRRSADPLTTEGATVKLEGKRILITGGGSGMGLELARRLADRNKVVIAGRDLAKLERARGDTSALQTRQLDVTSEEEARDGLGWVARELGGLDLLVNNAGLFRSYALSDDDAEAKRSATVCAREVDPPGGGGERFAAQARARGDLTDLALGCARAEVGLRFGTLRHIFRFEDWGEAGGELNR